MKKCAKGTLTCFSRFGVSQLDVLTSSGKEQDLLDKPL
jgi:hypothetical protein